MRFPGGLSGLRKPGDGFTVRHLLHSFFLLSVHWQLRIEPRASRIQGTRSNYSATSPVPLAVFGTHPGQVPNHQTLSLKSWTPPLLRRQGEPHASHLPSPSTSLLSVWARHLALSPITFQRHLPSASCVPALLCIPGTSQRPCSFHEGKGVGRNPQSTV